MRFDYDLLVPLATPANAPVELEVALIKGALRHIEVFFAPGCASWVYAIILDQLHQVAPANPGGSFNADGATIGFDTNYVINKAPGLLTCRAWSPLCKYDHTLIFRFDVDPEGESDQDALAEFLATFGVASGA